MNLFLDSIQKIVVIIATIFTAYWTSKTFTYNPKRDEIRYVSENIKNFLEALNSYESMKPLLDSLSEQNFITEGSKKHWRERSKDITRKTEDTKNILFDSIHLSNYIHKKKVIQIMSDVPVSLSDLKTKSDFDELKNKLRLHDAEIRKDAFFTIKDEYSKVKKYFGF